MALPSDIRKCWNLTSLAVYGSPGSDHTRDRTVAFLTAFGAPGELKDFLEEEARTSQAVQAAIAADGYEEAVHEADLPPAASIADSDELRYVRRQARRLGLDTLPYDIELAGRRTWKEVLF